MTLRRKSRALFFVLTLLAGGLAPAYFLIAASSEEISKQIQEKNAEIKRLEEEAQQYRDTLGGIERQADNLQSQIKNLDRSINRLDANIRVTNAKIGLTALEIERLE